ncbi:MAG: hypothetical protein JSU63_02315 [Phycisphaerales bacterium]|nr:MAG: hypothetical protein JSU63_02315 [Phycisphaerales bacterium]
MIASCFVALAAATLGQVTLEHELTAGVVYPGRVTATSAGVIYFTEQPDLVVAYDEIGATTTSFQVPEIPVGVDVHPDGRLFVARMDGQVGIYDPGAGFALLGTLDPTPLAPLVMVQPNDIAIDPGTGDVYVVDSGGHQVLKFDGSTGLGIGAFGAQGSGMGEFLDPQAIAFDASTGHVIVADTGNFRVQVFDAASGIFQYKFGYRTLYLGMTELAWVARAEGVAVDSCSNIYLTDALMGTVRAFDSTGTELDPAFTPVLAYGSGSGALRVPIDVEINNGNMWVVAARNQTIARYSVTCTAPRPGSSTEIVEETTDDSLSRSKKRAVRIPIPDDPTVIVKAINSSIYSRELDLNQDRVVDMGDLNIAVERFGGATVEDFVLRGTTAGRDEYPTGLEAPHLAEANIICGRCHNMNGAPGGMLTDWGQENLCISCHASSALAMGKAFIVPPVNSHPWGVAADAGDVAGPVVGAYNEIDLHLDAGKIRCGTCHDPHERGMNKCVGGANDGNECFNDAGCPDGVCDEGSGYLRDARPDGALCKQCHRGAGAPVDHAVGMEHGPEFCTDCHATHGDTTTASLTKGTMYSWYNGGMVSVGFTDNTIGVGDGGFVDPDAGEVGFCDVCHAYFDDSVVPPVVSAEFAALSVPHTASMPACNQCHVHENAFMPGLARGLAAGEWVGQDTCLLCHPTEHAEWDATLHKDARDNLPPMPIPDLEECFHCHTLGFGDPTGYQADGSTPNLAGVQCENCHGSGAEHVDLATADNIIIDEESEMCGACHTLAHHPTFDEWTESGHAVAFENSHRGSCNVCHAPQEGSDNDHPEIGVECVSCHDSHAQTGNDAFPDPLGERDAQLLHPEVAYPVASNTIADATDPTRFNLCGQCHHSRGRVWTATSRGPHHSLQGNVFLGEMPMPEGEEATPLAPNTPSGHAGLALQCNTCHMHTAAHEDGPPEVEAITGHSWHVDYEACAGCHGSAAAAEALTDAVQGATLARLDAIMAAMGDPADWEYTSGGGPAGGAGGQDDITDEVKKARFLVKYIEGDASFGVHNSSYTSAMLDAADALVGVAAVAPVYVGADVCAACHVTKHTEWTGTLHSEARNNLPALPSFVLAGCFPCHTVGYGQPTGFVDDATTANLAGVQCENCHGASSKHVFDPTVVHPVIDNSSELCGACHTDAHHPTYDQWSESGHEAAASNSHASYCNVCHAPEEGTNPHPELGVECSSCHEPHAQTGNNAVPDPLGIRDSQLLFPEYLDVAASNSIADATDPARFNLCGQCHHSRGRVWTATGRGPHHSLQGNVLRGEMPMPEGEELDPLVSNSTATHNFAAKQCATCHMYTEPFADGDASDGRWSESFVGGGFGQLGNLMHLASWDGATLGLEWEISGPAMISIVETNNVDGAGDGTIEYIATYTGGTATFDATLWGGSGTVTADVHNHEHHTTIVYVGGSADWAASSIEIHSEATSIPSSPEESPYEVIFLATASFAGPGGVFLPTGYPAYLGGATEGQWGSVTDAVVEKVAITGHSFEVNFEGCTGCHFDAFVAHSTLVAVQTSVQTQLDDLKARLGDAALWEYECCGGGPEGSPGQADLPDEILKVRFMIKYIEGDGSLGAHNGSYVQSILAKANEILDVYAAGGGVWPPAGGANWGACCDAVPACIGTMTEADCTTAGGTWHQAERCDDDEFVCP